MTAVDSPSRSTLLRLVTIIDDDNPAVELAEARRFSLRRHAMFAQYANAVERLRGVIAERVSARHDHHQANRVSEFNGAQKTKY